MKKQLIKGATLLAAFLLFVNFYTKRTGASDYSVTITNKNWNSVHLQVRTGNQQVPEQNALVEDVILAKDKSVTVNYDVLCYYRRDADPDHPDGKTFTTWTETGCFRNKPCKVDNP